MTNFMGYGSPEKLEAAITAEEGDEFVVYSEGLVNASVCSSLGLKETVDRMGRRLNGVNGWYLSEDKEFAAGQPNPCPCDRNPKTHQHYLFHC